MIKNLKENSLISKNRDRRYIPIKNMIPADSSFKSDKLSPDTGRWINGELFLKRKSLKDFK